MITNLTVVAANGQRPSSGTYGANLSVMWNETDFSHGGVLGTEIKINGDVYENPTLPSQDLWATSGHDAVVCEGDKITPNVSGGVSYLVALTTHYNDGTLGATVTATYVVPSSFASAPSGATGATSKGKKK